MAAVAAAVAAVAAASSVQGGGGGGDGGGGGGDGTAAAAAVLVTGRYEYLLCRSDIRSDGEDLDLLSINDTHLLYITKICIYV